jgi:co-chaperonin GroES (HSP10)
MSEHKLKKLNGGAKSGPHPFDGIRAIGEWLVVEQKGAQETTVGGLIVPETSREFIWVVVSAGEECKRVKEGDRILFSTPEGGPIAVDSRTYAMMTEKTVIAVLRMPKPEDRKLIQVVGAPS